MLFNTLEFAIFLPIIFILYWFLPKKKNQNLLLLLSSYFFYSCWDWRFLFLLIFSTLLDFFSGLKISNCETKKEKLFWLWLSITINIGFLGFFKYYNFFITEFKNLISLFGLGINPILLKIILPVGISFYTFHGLSYIIDIYNGKIKAEKDIITYSLFVNFFPLLVAGPIERATHLLPQIKKQRKFNYSKSVDGLRQILWGLVKKIVIADQCAEQVNIIFNNYQDYSYIGLLIGAVLFSFQIYGDFSGYSDIALGTARLFGFELLQNFSFPYFSRDIAEFWRRWHISLSSWFKDYLYIPLGGNKGSNWAKIRNTLIIFLVSGFWHGANWTYIFWGLLNALYILPLIIFKKNRSNIEIVAFDKTFPNLKELASIIITFTLTTFAWIFFRATSVKQALNYISNIIFLNTNGKLNSSCDKMTFFLLSTLILIFIFIEWVGRREKFAIEKIGLNWKFYNRNLFYFILIISLFIFGGKQKQFIYFDF